MGVAQTVCSDPEGLDCKRPERYIANTERTSADSMSKATVAYARRGATPRFTEDRPASDQEHTQHHRNYDLLPKRDTKWCVTARYGHFGERDSDAPRDADQ